METKTMNPMKEEDGAPVPPKAKAADVNVLGPRKSNGGAMILLLVFIAVIAAVVTVVLMDEDGEEEGSTDVPEDTVPTVEEVDSESCLNTLMDSGVNVSFPGSEVYENTYQFQLLTPMAAEAIAYPKDRNEMRLLLACANLEPALKVSVLGGASSFVGYGFGNPGNLVISMQHFDAMAFDEESETVTVEGGTRVASVAKYLWDNFGRIFVHVRGAYVGVAGSMIGGGFGTAARFLGIPGDRMIEVEYMLANGTIVTAGEGSDLLWAAQGAGSSFGIILSMKIKTYLHPRVNGTFAEIRGSDNVESTDQLADIFLAVQDFGVNDAPDTLAVRFHVGNTLRISMYDYGDPAEFDATLQPLVDRIANITDDFSFTEKEETSLWGMEVDSTGSSMNEPFGGPVGVRAFYIQALTTQADILVSKNVISTFLSTILAGPPNDNVRVGGFLDLWGGVSADVEDTDHSFIHGNNLWLFRTDVRLVEDPVLGEEFDWPEGTEEAYKAQVMIPTEEALLNDGHALRGFGNYRDKLLNFDEWTNRLYGVNILRLEQIKEAVDPTGMFTNNNQSIPVCE